MPGAAPSDCDTWTLDRPVAGRSTAVHQATLFALANGMIGVRGGIEELDRDHATILAEAVQHRPISYHERFPGFADATDTRLLGPGVTALAIAIDGLPIDFSAAEKLHCKRQLCVKTATLSRETDWALPDGRRLRVSTLRLVPIGDAPLCVQVVTIEALNFAGLVELSFPIAMASGGGETCDDPRISAKAGFIPAGSQSNARGHVARFVSGGDGTVHLSVAQALSIAGEFGETDLDRSASARLAPGQCMIVNRLVAVAADDQIACTSLDQARLLGIAALSERHQQALDQWWQQSEIAIEGDARLTLAIRYNLLHLFMSASRSDRHGIAAKGLTGEGYEGHYFWDTEVFVLPVLALMQPALARNVLGYRIARLDKARANARALGHSRGALFPWRTIEGDECSAHYPTGAAQYHVNAAIAFALESYINVTGDHSILTEGAADLLVETARLWADLGHFSARRGGAFLIHGVTGPDEYTALVDNDYYTNAMARQHLRFAVRVMAKLQSEDPLAYAAVADRLALDPAETEHWALAADRMWLPVDPASGVHPQDDSFMEKPEFPGLTDPARRRPLLLSHHPMVLYRHRLCKQGDVIQAHQVAGIECSLAQLQRDYDYYEPLTTHDSTLSMTAFGIAAARLSRDEAALGFHRETALIDIDDLHGNSSHGVHMAAMAGSWLILAQGWAGLRIDGDQAELAPRCPAGWLGYRLRFAWRDSRIELRVTPQTSSYRLLDGPAVSLLDDGRIVEIGGNSVELPRPTIGAVIFDLDGVLTDTAEAHYRAWKQLCDETGIPFDRTVNESLKGIDRRGSLERILAAANRTVDATEMAAMLERKNGYYCELIAKFSPADLFPGVRDLLRACQRAGLKIGLASASRNAPELIARLGIAHFFDFVADPASLRAGKPDPEIFTVTARALGIEPSRCLGVEDAQAGIAAIRSAGMIAFGVGDAAVLAEADRVFDRTGSITMASILSAGETPISEIQADYFEEEETL